MQQEKKFFGKAVLNADDADFSLGENDVINLENFRTGSTDKGVVNTLESIGGHILIPNPNLPKNGVNICIGGADDLSNRRRLFFMFNDQGNHAIFCFDYVLDEVFTVLLNNDVVGGLQFDKYHYIDAARVENGCLYWTDNLNEPCRIDINAGINLYQPGTFPNTLPYTAPLNAQVIRIIRRPGTLPPTFTKTIDTTFVNNFVQYEAFQFLYRQQYRDYEISVGSPRSLTCNYNAVGDTSNRIDVSMPTQEKIDQDVIQVDLIAYYITSNTFFIIKSWTSANDAAAIAAHNAGTALTYTFFNDVKGIALDTNSLFKPFDSCPIYAKTMELAKNRLHFVNYTIGYDTPKTSSLALTGETQGDVVMGSWSFFSFHSVCNGFGGDVELYLLDISNIPSTSNPGYYVYIPGGVPPFPGSVDYAQCSFRGQGLFDVMNYYSPGCTNHITNFTQQGVSSTITNAPSSSFQINKRVMKSDASYGSGVTFYDYAQRQTGVTTPVKFYNPDRFYSQVNFTIGIDWTLSNTNALNEIPVEANYYSVNLTKCQRTRFFLSLRGKNATYATKDANGVFQFTTANYASNLNGCAFDISSLDAYQMGYVFTVGDIVKIYMQSGTKAELKITGQSGKWIITELHNLSTLNSSTKFLFEIYTPYTPTATEPYYEQAQIFPVLNPGTSNRQYSVTAGSFNGDTYLINRNDGSEDYTAETMSPSDKFYKNWNTDAGRSSVIDPIGQINKKNSGCFSNTLVNGTRTNGLSTFDPLDTYDLPSQSGAGMKLQLTSKLQKLGTVMLAICDGGQTLSIYLSEQTLQSTTGEQAITGIDTVVGTMNALRGSRGTLNPESVFEFKGDVYWFDIQNACWVQYSDNGLFDISDYKMTRVWKLFADQYKSMTPQEIEAFGNRPLILSCVDSYHDELLCAIPQLLADPPKGYLPDHPDRVYPFDIWDGQGKTIFYKLRESPNKWQGAMTFVGESMFSIENNLFALSGGQLYRCNDADTPGNFFGEQFPCRVMYVSNALPSVPKVYDGDIAVEGNMEPDFTYLYYPYPYEQATDVEGDEYTAKEGIFYKTLFRNKLDVRYPNMSDALLKGEPMRATAMFIMHEFDVSDGPCELKFSDIGYNQSQGHSV